MADMAGRRGARVVAAIGVFKLAKSALLTLASLGWLLRENAAGGPASLVPAVHWTGSLPGHHVVRQALGRLGAFDQHTLRQLAIAALCYAAVFAAEGIGLLRRKPWAEWLTVVVTASFLPVEVYELVRHRGAGELVALVVNTAIVAYLVGRRLSAASRRTVPWPGRLSRPAGGMVTPWAENPRRHRSRPSM
jgi:uncharacterized membrane protein (DUF2068 family)